MTTALIDADVLVYEAATSVEVEIQWDEWLWTLHSDLDAGIFSLDSIVQNIQDGLQAERVVMVLSDYTVPNWRLKIMPEYKGNRKEKRRPIIWKALREYIEEAYETWARPSLEGDDTIGVLLTSKKIIKGEKICVSIDKDMLTLPGKHLNLKEARKSTKAYHKQVFTVTEPEADFNHLLQAVSGDAVDGYPGCPGVGPVTAQKAFALSGANWETVVNLYEKKGLHEYEALRNAQVARICRASDYDFKKKEVIPWEPRKKYKQLALKGM